MIALFALFFAAPVITPSKPASSPPAVTAVLVHGAFADGSGWRQVIPLLEAKALHALAV